MSRLIFPFRPWVRRTGLSVLLVAAGLTAAAATAAWFSDAARYGWVTEPAVAVYLVVMWLGGLKVFGSTYRPFAELSDEFLLIRPLHMFTSKRIPWSAVAGTEQMIRGDRLIIYFRGRRGMRFVAVNLNLVKGRRDFLQSLDQRLRSLGFQEKMSDQSRYLSKGPESRVPSPGSAVRSADGGDPAPLRLGTREPGPGTSKG